MLVALIAIDKTNALDLRLANRDAHVAYLKASDCVHMAGPFLDAEGKMIGSMIILDVADMSAAEDWATNDPYAKAELFQSVTLTQWNRVIG